MTSTESPDYALFARTQSGPGRPGFDWRGFLEALEPGVPVEFDLSGRKHEAARTSLTRTAQALGMAIATRNFNGGLWVCLLSGEDAERRRTLTQRMSDHHRSKGGKK